MIIASYIFLCQPTVNMGLFDALLSKIKNTIDTQQTHQIEVGEIIYKTIGIRINPENIHISNNTLQLIVPPTVRTAVLLKKDTLIVALRSKGIFSIT